MDRLYRRRKKQSFPLTFHSTSRPKRALLWVLTTSFLVAAPAWPQPPGLWWCKHRDRRGAEMENEAMATRQTSKQAKTKAAAKANTRVINKPVRNSEREPERRNPRARSRSAAVANGRAGATAAAADGAVVHDKPERTHSGSKPTAARDRKTQLPRSHSQECISLPSGLVPTRRP